MNEQEHPASLLLKMEDVHKSYPMGGDWIEVLKGVSLELKPGGIMAVVGASGAGKSTLLHIIGALDRPTRGNYMYRDQEVFARTNSELSRFRSSAIGFVFQFHHLLPEFTALENTMMPLMISKRHQKEEMREKAQKLLAEVGLQNREFHIPAKLSGGEQQRVAIARALANDPELLLADEPTGNLDTQTSLAVFDLMLRLNAERGMSMIVVTHNLELARLAGSWLHLHDGVIVD
jgi:lipoprotein-releasing system ATP-binding protein